MQELLEPLQTESLKDLFVTRFEHLILSGRLAIGQRLPSERELALQLAVSRPVVHEGLLDLAAKGLVTITPRVGTTVNDFRREGSLALLNSLFNYHHGRLAPDILDSLLAMRRLFEVETARLAARSRTDVHLAGLAAHLAAEAAADHRDVNALSELDFAFHLLVATAGGNLVYPLLLNSCKAFYTNLSGRFFALGNVAADVFAFHRRLADALVALDEDGAAKTMTAMLAHGEHHLKAALAAE